jgi:hypothetical protein
MTGVPQLHPVLSYNCIQYGNGGTGSIHTYPEFVDPSEGFGIDYDGAEADWSLLDSSPCINAGTPDTSGLFLPTYDINLEQRIYGAGIEMGAYENQHVIVGLNDAETTTTLIYPNPVKDLIFIDFIAIDRINDISLFTPDGRIVENISVKNQNNRLKISLPQLPAGFYVLSITQTSGEVVSRKIVVL